MTLYEGRGGRDGARLQRGGQQPRRPTWMHNGGPVGFYAESPHRLIPVSKTMLATVSQLEAT